MVAVSNIGGIWNGLEPRQRLIAALAAVAIAAALYGVWQSASQPPMATLYSGLDSQAAGEVMQAVEGMGATAQLSGSAVMVPAAERDRLRLALAAEGLPRNGPAGYELLDAVDGFGTTSEMFEATYWRAKEGELARTILAAPGVRSARVHIANPVNRAFQRTVSPTASVTVTTSYGPLEPATAEAIRYMVSSAVAGLTPTSVSVIDAAYGAVLRSGEEASASVDGGTPGGAREAELRSEVERLLAARVGEGKAIVSVSVDAQGESERITERIVDPQSRVVISSDSRELTETSKGTAGGGAGAATVASNLPQAEGGGESESSRAETEERVNYEVSETTRERIVPAGEVRRLTVAVLVDGVSRVNEAGERAWSPRSQEELDQLRELVRAAVGFNAERGDVVTVETLQFAEKPEVGAVATADATRFLAQNGGTLAQMAIFGLIALGLALFVLRPILRASQAPQAAPEAEGPMDWPVVNEISHHETEEDDDQIDRIALLKNTFSERRDESATVLRGWLEKDVQAAAEQEGQR